MPPAGGVADPAVAADEALLVARPALLQHREELARRPAPRRRPRARRSVWGRRSGSPRLPSRSRRRQRRAARRQRARAGWPQPAARVRGHAASKVPAPFREHADGRQQDSGTHTLSVSGAHRRPRPADHVAELAGHRRGGGTVDAAVSKTAGGNPVWVRLPLPARFVPPGGHGPRGPPLVDSARLLAFDCPGCGTLHGPQSRRGRRLHDPTHVQMARDRGVARLEHRGDRAAGGPRPGRSTRRHGVRTRHPRRRPPRDDLGSVREHVNERGPTAGRTLHARAQRVGGDPHHPGARPPPVPRQPPLPPRW